MRANKTAASYNISIHAPRTGSDSAAPTTYKAPSTFQSTLPARGATRTRGFGCRFHRNFNPRSPHGERRRFPSLRTRRGISIHAPRTGSDLDQDICDALEAISIHAPRTGSDVHRRPAPCRRWNFNPRSPHGERRVLFCVFLTGRYFNPRSPHGERQATATLTGGNWSFQSTLPARGATNSFCSAQIISDYFNPRSPHGERLRVACSG